jgi:cytoskeletal protein RodZ
MANISCFITGCPGEFWNDAMASFGERLRRERELRGVSLRDVASETKIGMRFLQAIEEDRLDLLPGGMFPRAFVRQYAASVGLDPERAVGDFEASLGETPTVAAEARPRSQGMKPWRSPWVIVGCVGLLALVLALRPSRRAPQSPGAPQAPAFPATRSLPPAPVQVPAPSKEGLVLTLRAQQRCWVEARVDGRSVLNRELREGETATIEATDEIRLSVGNAGGLSYSLNNVPGVPLGRSGEVRRNIRINRENVRALTETSTRSEAGLSG